MEISQKALELGHTLTYRQISAGLAKAPVNLNLPQTTSKWLRRKYEKIESDFSAMSSMRDLVQEALSRAGEAQEELDSDDGTMTSSRRISLENARDKWLSKAFDWSRDTATLEVEVGSIIAQVSKKQESQPAASDEAITRLKDEIMADFNAKMPDASEAKLIELYGDENIRMSSVGLEHENTDDEA